MWRKPKKIIVNGSEIYMATFEVFFGGGVLLCAQNVPFGCTGQGDSGDPIPNALRRTSGAYEKTLRTHTLRAHHGEGAHRHLSQRISQRRGGARGGGRPLGAG